MSDKNKRFWDAVDVRGQDDCWPWKNYLSQTGYGVLWFDGKPRKAHRTAFLLTNGYLPEAVCHVCDNRRCCNPNHLFAGTKLINNADRHAKGRSNAPRGEQHGAHKLTADDVVEIRRLIMSGLNNTQIANKFNVTHYAICDIKRGKTWKHVQFNSNQVN